MRKEIANELGGIDSVNDFAKGKPNKTKLKKNEEQKGTRYIQGNIYFDIIVFSCLLSAKLCLRFLLICFAWEIGLLFIRVP